MNKKLLTEQEAEDLVGKFMRIEGRPVSTQEILNSGAIPKLKGYVVRHGKVSDCIFGGLGDFVISEAEESKYRSQLKGLDVNFKIFIDPVDNKTKLRITFQNPRLRDKTTNIIAMVRTGRISSHDIERGSIPFKDQILAENHDFMRRLVLPFLGSSQYEFGFQPSSVVIVAEKLVGMDYENVIRAYMAKSTTTTSLYHAYMIENRRVFAGHDLSNDLYPNGPIGFVADTPSYKSDLHDETVPPAMLFEKEICTPQAYYQRRNNSLAAFGAVTGFLLTRNIIIADSKEEQGYNRKGIVVAKDELYTMDSSRFWLLDDYKIQQNLFLARKYDELIKYLEQTQPGVKEKDYMVDGTPIMVPRSFSKEFARGYSVKDHKYTDEQRAAIAVRYILGRQHLLQTRFEPDMRPWEERVVTGLRFAIEQLVK